MKLGTMVERVGRGLRTQFQPSPVPGSRVMAV